MCGRVRPFKQRQHTQRKARLEVLKCRERGERRGKSPLSAEGVTRVPRRLEGGEDAREGGSMGEPARGAGGAGLRAAGNLDLNRASASAACPLQLTGGKTAAKRAKTNRADQIWRVPCQEV